MAKTTEQMVAAAEKAGVTITVTTKTSSGEIVPLPGIRGERPA